MNDKAIILTTSVILAIIGAILMSLNWDLTVELVKAYFDYCAHAIVVQYAITLVGAPIALVAIYFWRRRKNK
jgi:hypothetical protein